MEYIHNTTFIVERGVADEFVGWAKAVYMPAAEGSELFSNITLARILTEVDPAAVNYSIQMRSESLKEAEQWDRDTAVLLKDDLAARLGADRVLFFATDMEIIR